MDETSVLFSLCFGGQDKGKRMRGSEKEAYLSNYNQDSFLIRKPFRMELLVLSP